MKRKFYKIVGLLALLFLISTTVDAQPGRPNKRPGGSLFISGAEFQFVRLGDIEKSKWGRPDTVPDTVLAKLIIYKSCAAKWTAPLNAANTAISVVRFSNKCCEYVIDTFVYDAQFSEKYATPLCPNSIDKTECAIQSSNKPGYQTEVYTDTIILKCKADDWRFGFLYASTDDYSNFYPFQDAYNPWGLGSSNSQLNRNPWNPPVTWIGAPPPAPNVNPFYCRIDGTNTVSMQNVPNQAGLYIEAMYSNNIVIGVNPTVPQTPKTIANNSPISVVSPLIFQCLGVQRTYDLGYYDVEGHYLTFEPTEIFKDVNASGTNNNLTTSGTPLLYKGGASYLQPFGSLGGSFFNVDKYSGKVSFLCNNGLIGRYKTGIKVTEYDVDPQANPAAVPIGETTRDIVVTIIDDPQCLDTDYLANSSYFVDNSLSDLSNCGIAPNRVNTIEACAGSKIKFSVSAYSKSSDPSASPIIDYTAHHSIIATNSSKLPLPIYKNHTFPDYDTVTQAFEWTIPDTFPPGQYWVKFQINSCISTTYLLARDYIVYIRINDKTEILSEYTNFSPSIDRSIFQFPKTKLINNCDPKMSLQLTGNNNIPDALFNWYDLTSGITSNPISQNSGDNKFNLPTITNMANLGTQKIALVSNQYCNNTDTITIVNHFEYSPTSKMVFKDTCINTVGTLTVDNLPNKYLMDWQTNKSIYKVTPSIYSNVSKPMVKNTYNTYDVYAYLLDYSCPFFLSNHIDAQGIKPRGKYTTDKIFACPLDTISAIQLKMSTALCGAKTNYSHIKPGIKIAQFNSTNSNIDSIPKIFTASPGIDRMRTQVLYRASDMRKSGFKPGVIDKLAFNLDGIFSPLQYNNIKIRVTCTDKTDLQNLKFVDTSEMILIVDTASKIFNVGWNTFVLGQQFTWDDSTNLIFEFTSTCNFPQTGLTSSAPAYVDRLTSYISTIGRYGKGEKGFDRAPIVGSNFCPDIRFEYYELGDTIEYKWSDISSTSANLSITLDTSTAPKFVSTVPRSVQFVYKNGECFVVDTLSVIYDTNFSIKLDTSLANKCPGDTVQIDANFGIPKIRPMNLNCGTDNNPEDSCRVYDTKYTPFIGDINTTVGNANSSPFGGSGALGSVVTDKRLQFILPYRELKKTPGMVPGYIDSITFMVSSFFANTNGLSDFSIKLKCIPDTMEFFYSNSFESNGTFEEVYTTPIYTPVNGDNKFKLSKKFAWNGKTGLMVDVCFDNPSGLDFNSCFVKGTTLSDSSTLYRSSNLGNLDVGCNYVTANKSKIRPDIKLSICAATRPKPPIPSNVAWAPTTFINNTSIYNPIVYNVTSTDYYVIQRYIDTNYGQNKVVCIVRDTFLSKVNRPLAEFNTPVACDGDSAVTIVGIKDTADNLYSYIWDTTQIGVNKIRYSNPKQEIFPNSPGYYRVYFYETNKPNCYNLDSVYINIQKRSIMPNIGGPAQFCKGDTIKIDIPTSIGYKKPVWLRNQSYIDTGYSILIADTGTYIVYVDSGACRNYSNQKNIAFRPIDTASINIPNATICEGDTAELFYNLSAGINKPIWNTGSTSLVIKVTQPGIYYIINPRNQYGCLYKLNDTGRVTIVDNPKFTLNSDTICMSANGKVVLQPSPLDANATYEWQPVNYFGSSYEATLAGLYTVTRTKGNCKQIAQTFVVNDTPGVLNLGINRAICCDEVLTLNANPQNLQKYKTYKWSTDERSQFIYTKPNSSGKYVVEAFKANGCRDTGSIYIKSLCANVRAQVQQNMVQIGELNPIIGTFDSISHATYSFNWTSPDAINKVVNPSILNAITKPGDTGDVEYVLTMQIVDSTYMPPKQNCVENAVVRYKVKPNGIDLVDWFSPNQDGDRDVFWPSIKGNVKITDFKVYNRFGQMIHNETIPWDGKFKGEPQPIGAYVGLISYELDTPRKGTQIVHKQISISLFR